MLSIKYSRGSLEVLDQLLLPHESVYVPILSAADAWSVIRTMQVRGAPLIAIVGALGIAVELESKRSELSEKESSFVTNLVRDLAAYLRTSRPTAVNLFTAMDTLTSVAATKEASSGTKASDIIDSVIEAAEVMIEEDIATNRAIGFHGAKKILELVNREKVRVLTICNTGALACAGFGTALGVVRALNELGKLEHVYACETRPYNQGARLTAYEIVQDKLPGTLITDSMASALMAVRGVDVVVVGADRVAANGDTANKIGTYQLAIAANYHRIPFFAAVPTTTLDLTMSSGIEIHVEERPGAELTTIFDRRIAPEGINVWNPAFDVTPCSLIAGIITELGVIEQTVVDPTDSSKNYDTIIPVAAYLRKHANSSSALLKRCEAAAVPISAPIGYDRMDLSKIGNYVLQQSRLVQILNLTPEDVASQDSGDKVLKITEVGDGNLNFVYVIEGRSGAKLVVKQALPYVRCVGENWPLTLQRAFFEYKALSMERQLAGDLVPEVYHFDYSKSIIVMRYVEPPHLILRKHLIAGTKITTFANDLGVFAARTLFGTSGLALEGGDMRLHIAEWSKNAAMCALTEKVIFTDPYTTSPMNRWTKPQLDSYAEGIRNDTELKYAIAYFKRVFITSTQALLHGDLHTGSVMAMEGSTFIIDPEFAFYGPMGFDLGAVLSNLYLSYFSYSVKGNDDYAEWVLAQIEIFYAAFEANFIQLWNERLDSGLGAGEFFVKGVYSSSEHQAAQKDFLRGVWREALGFTGAKMIRRIVGIAHVEDLESITEPDLRSVAEKRALTFGRTLLVASYNDQISVHGWNSIEQVNTSLARTLFRASPSDSWPSK